MRIFFTTPYSGKQYFQPYINEIMSVLKKTKAIIISPENTESYQASLTTYKERGMQPTRAHYAFIANAIAEADIVIIEASKESLQIGHEVTLALLYGKPTLVVSQNKNYTKYISHELLNWTQYETKRELRKTVENFVKTTKSRLSSTKNKSVQTLEATADSLHLATLATMRQQALQDNSEFGKLADLAERDPEKAAKKLIKQFGSLPIEKPWTVFSSIYSEDTPDFIFSGVMQFILQILQNHSIKKQDHIIDVYTHSGVIARQLLHSGYTNLTSFSSSREMLAETYLANAKSPEIKIIEATPSSFTLASPAKAVVWVDYTTNFALTETELHEQLQNMLANIAPGGCFIFDVRTVIGWNIYFFREKIAAFGTQNFQRFSLNLPDDKTGLIVFDRFIRIKQNNGEWGPWRREQMTDRMWSLEEVKKIVSRLNECTLEGIYDDTFSPITDDHEPNLAYFVLKKQ